MSIFGSLLGGALSLFGASKARRQAKQDAMNKFVDLRAAAEAGGFNPLTALGATGGAGFGAYGSSAPPLASIELLTGAIGDYEDERNGTAELRRSTDRLNYDLAKIKLDQARSGVYAPPPPKAYAAAGGTVFADNTAKAYPAAHVTASASAAGGVNGSSGFAGNPYSSMVDVQASDGSVHKGPNPGGPDADQALYGILSDAYYRGVNYRNSHTFGTPIEPSVSPWLRPFFKGNAAELLPDHTIRQYRVQSYKDRALAPVRNPRKLPLNF